MTERGRLFFGPLGFLIFLAGLAILPLMLPGYSQVRQTFSEVGDSGSPMRIPFAILLCSISFCIVVFATALRDGAKKAGRSTIAAWLTFAMAISVAGVCVFAYPHPLHNVFGLSELLGYQAPLALAISWRRDYNSMAVVRFSALMAALVWIAIALNLATLDRSGALFAFERSFYGLVQRALFVAWFVWCAGTGLLLRYAVPLGSADRQSTHA